MMGSIKRKRLILLMIIQRLLKTSSQFRVTEKEKDKSLLWLSTTPCQMMKVSITRNTKKRTVMNLTLKRKTIKLTRTITSSTFKNTNTLSSKAPVTSNLNMKLKILL
jgi:hypothetical protein